MVRDVGVARNNVHQLRRSVLGVACHKPHAVFPAERSRRIQQFGKSAAACVGVHVLPQQGNVFISAFDKLFYLVKHRVFCTRSLVPARVGDYAVGAKIIAPVHCAYPGAVSAFTQHRHTLAYHAELGLRFFAYKREPLFRAEHRFNYFRHAVVHIRSENKIHVGVAFVDLLAAVRLLRHTAAKPYF